MGRGFEGMAGRRMDLEAVSFKSSGKVQFFLKTPDCSFNARRLDQEHNISFYPGTSD